MEAPKLFGVPMKCINPEGDADSFYLTFGTVTANIGPRVLSKSGEWEWFFSTPDTYDNRYNRTPSFDEALRQLEAGLRATFCALSDAINRPTPEGEKAL